MKNEIILKPFYCASISGGKDSMYMLNLILNNPNKYPLNAVIHYDLEIDYPFIKNIINRTEEALKLRGIELVRLKPPITWRELYDKYGYPTRRARWCNSKYKLGALTQYRRYLLDHGYNLVSYIGFCADEVKRFRDNSDVYPLAMENINESEILEWAKNEPMYNDYYKYMKRCGCMGCPMSARIEFAYLAVYYPERYREIIELMSKTEHEKNICITDGHGKYNAEYIDNIVKEKYIPKLLELVKEGEPK